jgi:hypothetical protein
MCGRLRLFWEKGTNNTLFSPASVLVSHMSMKTRILKMRGVTRYWRERERRGRGAWDLYSPLDSCDLPHHRLKELRLSKRYTHVAHELQVLISNYARPRSIRATEAL